MWTPRGERVSSPRQVERAAIDLLAGVGADREWWLWNPSARVGHLRVALTAEENQRIPEEPVVADAGDTGPERTRTTPRK